MTRFERPRPVLRLSQVSSYLIWKVVFEKKKNGRNGKIRTATPSVATVASEWWSDLEGRLIRKRRMVAMARFERPRPVLRRSQVSSYLIWKVVFEKRRMVGMTRFERPRPVLRLSQVSSYLVWKVVFEKKKNGRNDKIRTATPSVATVASE